jgi:hypothetical protein
MTPDRVTLICPRCGHTADPRDGKVLQTVAGRELQYSHFVCP